MTPKEQYEERKRLKNKQRAMMENKMSSYDEEKKKSDEMIERFVVAFEKIAELAQTYTAVIKKDLEEHNKEVVENA